jgi:hypothetical protein
MDLYSGNLTSGQSSTGTWKSKQETAALFKPVAQPVTSDGSSGNALNYGVQRQASAVSGIQNNVLPFTQIQVGPGLGTTKAAIDGFHSQYRVLPPDAYGYKRNELEGRVVPGASAVAARAVDPNPYVKGVPRTWDMARRPLEKGRATATGQTLRPEFSKARSVPSKTTGCRVEGEDYYGIAGAAGQNVEAGAWSRNKTDLRPGLPLTNATGTRASVGGYVGKHYDEARFSSQQREATNEPSNAMLTGNHIRHQAPNTFDVAMTNRDLAKYRDYSGGAAHFVSTGSTRPGDAPSTTLRELLHAKSPGPGAVAPIVTGQTVQCTDRQLLKEAKRGSYVVNTYVAAPERTEEFRRANVGDSLLAADRACGGRISLRSDVNAARINSHAASSSMYQNNASSGKSTTDARNKLPVVNAFQDFGIAKAALKGNEFAVNIN